MTLTKVLSIVWATTTFILGVWVLTEALDPRITITTTPVNDCLCECDGKFFFQPGVPDMTPKRETHPITHHARRVSM